MTSDFSVATPIAIGRKVDVDGQGHTITFSTTGQNLVVTGDGAHVHNIAVKNTADTTKWNSTYGVQFYNGTYTIENITSTGANAGILVNSSTATLGSGVDVSGNNFGGIEVSQSSNEGSPASSLTVNSKIVNTTEAYGKPTVWTDGDNASVTDKTGMTANGEIKENQVQYYLDVKNSTK